MTTKVAFVRHWKRLEVLMAAFAAITVAAFFFDRDALPWLWGAFLPVWSILLLRLRCWNCGERLMRDGAAHIEWTGNRLLKGKPSRHKRCGAELS